MTYETTTNRVRLRELPAGRGETVLMVDDERALLTLGRKVLERLGYRVLSATTAEEALAIAEKAPEAIHLLLTDVIMPGIDGRLLADRVKSHLPNIRILFMSGYTFNVIADRGVLNEGVKFIQKPFTIDRLAVKVREALEEQ